MGRVISTELLGFQHGEDNRTMRGLLEGFGRQLGWGYPGCGVDHLREPPLMPHLFLETLLTVVKLCIVTEPLHGVEPKTDYMKLRWMCSVDETQSLVVDGRGPVPW